MRDVPSQLQLFPDDDEPPILHFFYATTNSAVVKVGMAKNTGEGKLQSVEKRMKRDAQFKGHVPIWAIPCSCTPRIVMGRKKCESEIAWENAHAADRLPASEHYRPFGATSVWTALRFAAGQDQRAIAVLEWLKKHGQAGAA